MLAVFKGGFLARRFLWAHFSVQFLLERKCRRSPRPLVSLRPPLSVHTPTPTAGPFKTVSFTSRLLASLRSRSLGFVEGLILPQSDAKLSLWGKPGPGAPRMPP